jgi:hypothetical protein
MGQQARTRLVLKDFPGLVTDADPHDVPKGAAREQLNVAAERPGELKPRLGYRLLRFDRPGED